MGVLLAGPRTGEAPKEQRMSNLDVPTVAPSARVHWEVFAICMATALLDGFDVQTMGWLLRRCRARGAFRQPR